MVAPDIIATQRARAAQAKRKRRYAEEPAHRSILRYLRATLPASWIIQHTPNNPRSARSGARDKGLGSVVGWPDLAVYGPGPDGPSAWFFEVKAPKVKGYRLSQPTQDQLDCHDALLDAGFRVRVVRSIDDVRQAISDWGLPSLDMRVSDRTGRAA